MKTSLLVIEIQPQIAMNMQNIAPVVLKKNIFLNCISGVVSFCVSGNMSVLSGTKCTGDMQCGAATHTLL